MCRFRELGIGDCFMFRGEWWEKVDDKGAEGALSGYRRFSPDTLVLIE